MAGDLCGMPHSEYRLQSPPMKLHWAGWTSDTWTLQRAGWDVSVSENYDAMTFNLNIQMALRYRDLYAISARASLPPGRGNMRYDMDMLREMSINIDQMGADIISRPYVYHTLLNWSDFSPVDTRPDYVEVDSQSMRNANIFRKIESANDIVVPEYSVQQLLDMALEMQAPKQREIRDKMRKQRESFAKENVINIDDYRQETDVVAQIMVAR